MWFRSTLKSHIHCIQQGQVILFCILPADQSGSITSMQTAVMFRGKFVQEPIFYLQRPPALSGKRISLCFIYSDKPISKACFVACPPFHSARTPLTPLPRRCITKFAQSTPSCSITASEAIFCFKTIGSFSSLYLQIQRGLNMEAPNNQICMHYMKPTGSRQATKQSGSALKKNTHTKPTFAYQAAGQHLHSYLVKKMQLDFTSLESYLQNRKI